MLNNTQQEALVANYQATGDEKYFEKLLKAYRSRIQGKASDTARRFGLDDLDTESALVEALWTAARKWDANKGIPFEKYVSTGFRQALTYLFTENKKVECPYEMEYYMAADGQFDLEDPRQDIENLIADQDSAKSLYEYLKKNNETAAVVAALRAAGYEHHKIAQLLDYKPEGNRKKRQVMWSIRRLDACQKPAIEYYFEVLRLDSIPINLRA